MIGQATISWNAVDGATTYNIYWSTSPDVSSQSGTKIADVTSPYTHSGLTQDTTYYYVVTAVNGYGESEDSDKSIGDDSQSLARIFVWRWETASPSATVVKLCQQSMCPVLSAPGGKPIINEGVDGAYEFLWRCIDQSHSVLNIIPSYLTIYLRGE